MACPPKRSHYRDACEFLGAWAAFSRGQCVPMATALFGPVLKAALDDLVSILLSTESEPYTLPEDAPNPVREALSELYRYQRETTAYAHHYSYVQLGVCGWSDDLAARAWRDVAHTHSGGSIGRLIQWCLLTRVEQAWPIEDIRQCTARMFRGPVRIENWCYAGGSATFGAVRDWWLDGVMLPLRINRLHVAAYKYRGRSRYIFPIQVVSLTSVTAVEYIAYALLRCTHSPAVVGVDRAPDYLREIHAKITAAADQQPN